MIGEWDSEEWDDLPVYYFFIRPDHLEYQVIVSVCFRGAATHPDVATFTSENKETINEHINQWELEKEVHQEHGKEEIIKKINKLIKILEIT